MQIPKGCSHITNHNNNAWRNHLCISQSCRDTTFRAFPHFPFHLDVARRRPKRTKTTNELCAQPHKLAMLAANCNDLEATRSAIANASNYPPFRALNCGCLLQLFSVFSVVAVAFCCCVASRTFWLENGRGAYAGEICNSGLHVCICFVVKLLQCMYNVAFVVAKLVSVNCWRACEAVWYRRYIVSSSIWSIYAISCYWMLVYIFVRMYVCMYVCNAFSLSCGVQI